MRIEYVEVSPGSLRGTGLGKQLVEKAVAFARDTQLKVVPICSYARAVIHRDPVACCILVVKRSIPSERICLSSSGVECRSCALAS